MRANEAFRSIKPEYENLKKYFSKLMMIDWGGDMSHSKAVKSKAKKRTVGPSQRERKESLEKAVRTLVLHMLDYEVEHLHPPILEDFPEFYDYLNSGEGEDVPCEEHLSEELMRLSDLWTDDLLALVDLAVGFDSPLVDNIFSHLPSRKYQTPDEAIFSELYIFLEKSGFEFDRIFERLRMRKLYREMEGQNL